MILNKEIGGYLEFSLETAKKDNFGPSFIRLNTARNCLEYILLSRKINKIYIPRFICHVVLEPIIKHNIKYEYYPINADFEPLIKHPADGYILLVNYFGIKDKFVSSYTKNNSKVILDLSQSFYFKEYPKSIDAFYSPRKFFGVSDGGYLHTEAKNLEIKETDISFTRMNHLFIRLEQTANAGLHDFRKNEKSLSQQPIKKMSRLTSMILRNLDFSNYQHIRLKNFIHLHERLGFHNKVPITLPLASPLSYPLLLDNGEHIKQKLINQRIFVPTFWPELIKTELVNSIEYNYAKNIVHLPIDHRYSEKDMDYICQMISDTND